MSFIRCQKQAVNLSKSGMDPVKMNLSNNPNPLDTEILSSYIPSTKKQCPIRKSRQPASGAMIPGASTGETVYHRMCKH